MIAPMMTIVMMAVTAVRRAACSYADSSTGSVSFEAGWVRPGTRGRAWKTFATPGGV
jgi:hypothetical protein